jgi:tRNA modification GTPase
LLDASSGHVIDQAMGCLMPAPSSYTGEDVFEIHCHGSPLVLERTLKACLAEGCRPARPGEFTLRAFLNGRMDLSQAEAVLDVVRARTNAGLELAMRQLAGWLSQRLEPIHREIMGVLARMEALIDFVEDDVPPQLDAETRDRLDTIRSAIDGLLEGAEQGVILREGASLAITGGPNVGKSSIMNALLGIDRSIVTPVAGTTRDTVEEMLEIRGVPFRAVDTAGITATEDPVERIGVERSRQALASADVVLLVFDRSRIHGEADEMAVAAVKAACRQVEEDGRSQRLLVALNKSDLPSAQWDGWIDDRLRTHAIVETSAITSGGLDVLRRALESVTLGGRRHEFVLGNVRHQDALRRALQALDSATTGLAMGTPLDLVSFDVRATATALGEITGASVDDELLDRIFRDFCIGK